MSVSPVQVVQRAPVILFCLWSTSGYRPFSILSMLSLGHSGRVSLLFFILFFPFIRRCSAVPSSFLLYSSSFFCFFFSAVVLFSRFVAPSQLPCLTRNWLVGTVPFTSWHRVRQGQHKETLQIHQTVQTVQTVCAGHGLFAIMSTCHLGDRSYLVSGWYLTCDAGSPPANGSATRNCRPLPPLPITTLSQIYLGQRATPYGSRLPGLYRVVLLNIPPFSSSLSAFPFFSFLFSLFFLVSFLFFFLPFFYPFLLSIISPHHSYVAFLHFSFFSLFLSAFFVLFISFSLSSLFSIFLYLPCFLFPLFFFFLSFLSFFVYDHSRGCRSLFSLFLSPFLTFLRLHCCPSSSTFPFSSLSICSGHSTFRCYGQSAHRSLCRHRGSCPLVFPFLLLFAFLSLLHLFSLPFSLSSSFSIVLFLFRV